jgi:hypothetical protein
MKVTLLDETGVELSEVTSHLGRSPDQMLVDWAMRPDALFQYYFDRRKPTVTAVVGEATWSAVLDTRWQMGARFWFLREFNPVQAPAEAAGKAPPFMLEPAPGVGETVRSRAVSATAALDAPAVARGSEPRGATS